MTYNYIILIMLTNIIELALVSLFVHSEMASTSIDKILSHRSFNYLLSCFDCYS